MCTLPEYFESIIFCDFLDFKCFPKATGVPGPTCYKNAAHRVWVEKVIDSHISQVVIVVDN